MSFSSSSCSSSTPTPHPEQKQKKPKSEEAEPEDEAGYKLIPSLPDDVALNCLARVPRSQHPTLSLVSKPIHSILSSPLLFHIRSLLHTTEHLLYLTACSLDNRHKWFALYRNPNVLVPIPPIPSPRPSIDTAYAALGPNIYVIGGSIRKIPSSQVWVLDCRFNLWRPGPTMLVGRRKPAAGVVNGKIYVMGGREAGSNIRAEVLDPAVGRWVEVPCPFPLDPLNREWGHASAVLDDKVYVNAVGGQVAFDPLNGVWESVEKKVYLGRRRSVMVDGILYSCDSSGKIKGLDVRQGVRKELKGLDEGLFHFWGRWATLASVGGKLIVVWRYRGDAVENLEIWCAEIEVNKNVDEELWGKVLWSQKFLSLPWGYLVERCSTVVL